MKKIFFAILSAFSILFMVSCDISFLFNRRELSKEETMFTLGRYPQTLVKDTNTYIEVLNKIKTDNLEWNTLVTYTTFETLNPESRGDAVYIDIDNDIDGEYDYRILKINEVRSVSFPEKTPYLFDPKIESPYQGYYLFTWEPVKWNIFRYEGEIDNKKEAYAACDVILDTFFFDLDMNEDYAKSDLRKMVISYFATQIFSNDELNELKGEPLKQTLSKLILDDDISSYENDSVQIATLYNKNTTTSSEDGSFYYKNVFSSTWTDYAKTMGGYLNSVWLNFNFPDSIHELYSYAGNSRYHRKPFQVQLCYYYGIDFFIIVDYDKYRPEGY